MVNKRVYDGLGLGTMKSGGKRKHYAEVTEFAEKRLKS